jgi:hypothetical protein
MMFLLWTALAFAGNGCKTIGLSDIAAVPSPAIIVLGVRPGAKPDLLRAARVLRRLQNDNAGPIVLAVDIVHHSKQHHLDRLVSGQTDLRSLEASLAWTENTAAAFQPYARLFSMGQQDVQLLAVGLDPTGLPDDIHPPVPGHYPAMVSETVSGDLPYGLDGRIAKTLAYWDYQIALRSVNEWSGDGTLVILTDRAKVEGGGGVPWQLVQAGHESVYAFLLAWAEPFCEDGDNVWAKVPLLFALGL